VLEIASRVAHEGAYLLLETLAYRVAREVLAFDTSISSVTVGVRKLRLPSRSTWRRPAFAATVSRA
jgi:dihydroneopterin aldolase